MSDRLSLVKNWKNAPNESGMGGRMKMSRAWWMTAAVVALVVGVLWLTPVAAKISSTGDVLACESLVSTWPSGVDPLPAFGISDDVVAGVTGGEDSPSLPTTAAIGVMRACDVERENRQTSLFLALGVGVAVLFAMRRRTAPERG